MQLVVEIPPTQRGIQMIDEMMKSYIAINELPYERELCFVLHELVINAVDAMVNAESPLQPHVKVKIDYNDTALTMHVIDYADGIPEEKWENILIYDFDSMGHLDRGRGLFFVKNMVDEIWFEYVAPRQFLVGVTKMLSV